jgi:hypothetical protein
MNADGSSPAKIAEGNRPAWSPDGKKIAFVCRERSDSGIYVMQADGSAQTRLAAGDCSSTPDWSPDGAAIAFTGNDGEIYLIRADGTGLQKLTEGARIEHGGNWSPAFSPLAQHPDCSSGWTRLAGVSQARVTGDTTTPNRVRSEPSRAAELVGLLEPGTTVRLLEGPVCAEGLVFWKVQHPSLPGGAGWTAEGDGSEYWLEPHTP